MWKNTDFLAEEVPGHIADAQKVADKMNALIPDYGSAADGAFLRISGGVPVWETIEDAGNEAY